DQLTESPLQLQLPQPQYGGRIELGFSEYAVFDDMLKQRLAQTGRDKLRAVLLDDSVYTGRSIFTMLGVCAHMPITVVGILVLISRLAHEVSEAVHSLSIPFAQLYRLHMPVLEPTYSPDRQLTNINTAFTAKASSYFGRRWATALRQEQSHFLWSHEYDSGDLAAPHVDESLLSNIRGHVLS